MSEAINFIASLPPIQSAISIDGRGEGARIKLDIPATEVGAVLLLQHYYSGRAFRVTITPDEYENVGMISHPDATEDMSEDF